MKHLISLILGVFGTLSLYADCAGNGLWVFPARKTIKQNSIFVIEGYAHSQNVILDLNIKHNVYLKSGEKKIKLFVTEICVGQFHLTQAILKPEFELEAGLKYTMYIDSLPEFESLQRYNGTTKKYESVIYEVIAGKDTEKPVLTDIPIELKKTLVQYGCGPSIFVVFSNPVKDSSEIIIRTTVKNLETGKETTYYIEPYYYNKIKVGHGMCSGAFAFDDNENYEVEFSFMDSSGNMSSWSGPRIQFTKPTQETSFEDE